MKHLQKLVPIVLAFVLALSLSLTALAEEDYGQEVTGEGNLFQNNEAKTTFSVVAVPANLSATVPLNVTFAVKRNGDFVCPGGYAITNTGSEIFHVSDIRVTMLDAAYSFVESDENLQDRQIYLTMTGTNPGIMSPISDTVTFVSGSDNTKQSFGTEPTTYNTWNVDQGGKIEFEFKGKVNGASIYDDYGHHPTEIVATSKSVANKMRSISKNHQVLCISHLAPIAAMADYNYFISKKVENDRTCTSIKLLNEQEVLCEIARISSGEINDVTLQYANELRSKIA